MFRSNSRENINYSSSVLRDNVRHSQQRYSTAELYKPQTSRRRSPSANVAIESHEWYDQCGMLDVLSHDLLFGVGAVHY